MEFHEIQKIQCPDRQSFDDHLGIWKDIELLAKEHACSFTWKVLSEKDWTYQVETKCESRRHHMNGLIKIIELLKERGIKPAFILDSEDLKHTKKNIDRAIEICEEVV